MRIGLAQTLTGLAVVVVCAGGLGAADRPYPPEAWPLPPSHPVRPEAAWTHGPWHSPASFPIGVWLQAPHNAQRYREIGVNLYLGLWEGPTEEQLEALRAAGMPVICDQNSVGLAHRDDDIIIGWLQQDEPDNAQPIYDPDTGEMTGYGPPVAPDTVVARYREMKAADPSRPVLLNLGQGLANEAWIGRGADGRPEDYQAYVWGGDIVSFDIYPVTNDSLPNGGHELWYVAKGLDRLRSLTGGQRIIWSILECTHVGNAEAIATPAEIRAQAWMSIIHGATGIVWFVHEFAPRFVEAGIFEHPDQLRAVTEVNAEITALAEVLNSPTRSDLAFVETPASSVPVDLLCKRHDGSLYVFAVAMDSQPTVARIHVSGTNAGSIVEALGEDRVLRLDDGAFSDQFDGWGVHLYRIGPA